MTVSTVPSPTLAVPRLALQRLVSLLSSINGLRTLVPEFARTLFVGGPSGVVARARNEVADLVWRAAEMTASAPFGCSLGGRQLRELAMALDGASVSIAVRDDTLVELTCGHYTGRLPAQSESAESAEPPTLDTTAFTVRVARAALARALATVRYASPRANDVARQGMAGVLVAMHEATLTVTATDGHRLAHASVALEAAVSSRVRIQFPLEAVQVLSSVLELSRTEMVTLSGSHCEDGRWLVVGDEFALTIAGLTTATFPAFQRLLPTATSHPAVVTIPRSALLGALTRVSYSSAPTLRRVTLSAPVERGLFDGLCIAAQAADMGEATEMVAGEGTVGFCMAVNPDYLGEAIRQGSQTEVVMSFRSPEAPVVLTDADDAMTALHLVMPVRIA
ncbi:MAG: hypothetical protein H3C62_01035 [Gemmatimonadaceae bacterium]|nr:hypothetical protein [Gemmatimonadaceae bacterium]